MKKYLKKSHKKTSPAFVLKTIYAEAWALTKRHIKKFALVLLLVILANIAKESIPQNTGMDILFVLVSLLAGWLSMGLVNICLLLLQGKDATFGDGFVRFNKTVKAFLAWLITSVFAFISLIPAVLSFLISQQSLEQANDIYLILFTILFVVFLIPVTIIGIRLNYTSTIILDEDCNPWEAVKTSWNITKGHVGSLFILNFVLGITQLLGIITLGIGLFRTVPFMVLAQTLAYKALTHHK